MVGLDGRRADDRVPLVDERDDLVRLVRRVAEVRERHRHGLVDDRDLAAADKSLGFHQRKVWLNTRGITVHHEGNSAGWSEDTGLRISPTIYFPNFKSLIPSLSSGCQ